MKPSTPIDAFFSTCSLICALPLFMVNLAWAIWDSPNTPSDPDEAEAIEDLKEELHPTKTQ